MKLNTDLILDSFKSHDKHVYLDDTEDDTAVISFKAKRKLERLVDLIRSTPRDQLSSDELVIKQKNYRLAKHILKKVLDCKPLDRGEMIFCNMLWRRYSG